MLIAQKKSYMTTSKQSLLLSLWSEVGRHLNLAESAPVFARALREQMAVGALHIDELDAERQDLVTLVEWHPRGDLRIRHRRRGCGASTVLALEAWARNGELAVCEAGGGWPMPISLIDGFNAKAPALAGALVADGRLVGMAVLLGGGRQPYSKNERELFRTLLEPLTAAVENDRRLREIQRLRAAAEADRRTLLARLGRKTLSETIVGADGGLRQVMERVNQVAPTDATVLILGETGAGKEVIARAIHERSARSDGPFVRVNCGAVPTELIDSELFGHEKGSFTGAVGARRGWFERADGGTLFLDEIGELTPAVQIRLLRILQDGIVQRVGSERDVSVDVRIIAATHRDLPTMVQQGRFREDLWYRLAVFPVILPPLRERGEDIPVLARHFVQRAANRLGVPVPPLSEADIRRLQAYRWPGNARELGAVLERAVILGRGAALDLETALGAGQPSAARDAGMPGAVHTEDEASPSLDDAVAAHLRQALRSTHGRVDGPHGAARLLKLNTSTLRAKLRKLGIDPRQYRE